MITFYKGEHLDGCADLLIKTFNCYPWEFHWTEETAKRYLREFSTSPRFVGFIIIENNDIVGASFCHEKTWWTDDELYCEEFFISPDFQRKGYGQALLHFMEQYVKDKKLAGITLMTNKYMPAPVFYKKNGFSDAEHVEFMYKVIS